MVYRPDLVVAPHVGDGPRVSVLCGGDFHMLANFVGIEDTGFRGGARTPVGDADGDGFGEVIVSAGLGGGPRVRAVHGRRLLTNPNLVSLDEPEGPALELANFFAGNPADHSGIRLAALRLDTDTIPDLIAGDGNGDGRRVRAYPGKRLGDRAIEGLYSFGEYPNFDGSVYVGVASGRPTRHTCGVASATSRSLLSSRAARPAPPHARRTFWHTRPSATTCGVVIPGRPWSVRGWGLILAPARRQAPRLARGRR